MVTVDSLLTALAESLERVTELEYELANKREDETLLNRLCGLEYPAKVEDKVKAITAAGGMAQSLERQDLETKITSAARLTDDEEEEEDDKKKD